MKRVALCWFVPLAALAIGSAWSAEGETSPEYVGVNKCKICHKPQFESWLETKHATAFDALSDEEKKKAECVGCHITAQVDDTTILKGVQCEACHGPGSEYKSPKIMNKKKWAADPETYRKTAVGAGLVYPTEETCTRCHKKEGNPNFKPFDFAKRKHLVHAVKTDTTNVVETKKPADTSKDK